MDILIKNIEMPKNGTLTLVVYPNGDVYLGDVLKDIKIGKAVAFPEHGELIDRNALIERIGNNIPEINTLKEYLAVSRLLAEIGTAPTIVEATE